MVVQRFWFYFLLSIYWSISIFLNMKYFLCFILFLSLFFYLHDRVICSNYFKKYMVNTTKQGMYKEAGFNQSSFESIINWSIYWILIFRWVLFIYTFILKSEMQSLNTQYPFEIVHGYYYMKDFIFTFYIHFSESAEYI